MTRVTETLGLARSNIAERVKGVRPKRGPQTRDGDLEVSAEIRRLVDARPTYGMAPVNAKRVYRLMKKHGLLLARHTGRRRPREHDGQVATLRSNIRWCSDGLEFTCWNGEIVRVAFALDCHDREIIGRVKHDGRHLRRDDPRHDGSRAALWHHPRAPSGAMALRQRLDLRRPQDHRDRRGTQPGAMLHASRKP